MQQAPGSCLPEQAPDVRPACRQAATRATLPGPVPEPDEHPEERHLGMLREPRRGCGDARGCRDEVIDRNHEGG